MQSERYFNALKLKLGYMLPKEPWVYAAMISKESIYHVLWEQDSVAFPKNMLPIAC